MLLPKIRTNYLSRIVNSSLDTWYKVAYVGMDDFESKKEFITSSGMPLNCIKYRAWAPGHPRFEPNQNNCVVLDTEKMWRVVDCKRKMPAICEIFPQPPKEEFDFSALDCLLYSNKSERNTCDTKVLLWQIYKNTSRMEQCAIVNDLLKIKNDLN